MKKLYKVCGTSVALSWLFASLAHNSLPGVPDNLSETDFDTFQVKIYV